MGLYSLYMNIPNDGIRVGTFDSNNNILYSKTFDNVKDHKHAIAVFRKERNMNILHHEVDEIEDFKLDNLSRSIDVEVWTDYGNGFGWVVKYDEIHKCICDNFLLESDSYDYTEISPDWYDEIKENL